jgi:hypothetical protein
MKKTLIIIPILFLFENLTAEIIVFKDCTSEQYKYEKNDYTLDLNKELMTREFIYSEESYKKLRNNDITIKKNNKTTKRVTKVNGLIVTEITGYPAFYTQLVFNDMEKNIKIKTVLNNTEGVSLISKCKKVIKFKKQT